MYSSVGRFTDPRELSAMNEMMCRIWLVSSVMVSVAIAMSERIHFKTNSRSKWSKFDDIP